MKTRVEINNVHRARLLQVAARTGHNGFSRIVSEATEQYLAALDRSEADPTVLDLRGTLSRRQAERLCADTAQIRRSWR